jgi:hypothetical protein
LGEPVDVDHFYSPTGTLDDVPNGAATSITVNQSNGTDLTRVLFKVASIVNNEAIPNVSVPTEVNRSPKKPMEQPELFNSPWQKNHKQTSRCMEVVLRKVMTVMVISDHFLCNCRGRRARL